jgi:hypothetical protein
VVSRIWGFVGLAATFAIVAALALPASASAADTYADANTGNDGNDCLTPSTPCATVAAGLSKSDPGDTTFISGEFETPGGVTLGDGKSLMASGGSPFIFVGGFGGVALTVDASGAGTVSGVSLIGESTAMQVNGPVTIDNDTFAAGDGSTSGSDVNVQTDDPVAITNSRFYTPTSGPTSGISVDSPAASVDISHNRIGLLDSGDGQLAAGVNVLDGGTALRRNEIFGTDVGVRVTDSSLPVTLENDLIHDNTVGLQATDTSGDTPPSTQGDVSATNETIFNSSDADVRLDHTTLTMDSSIVGTPVDLVGAGTCEISFSRGPASSVGSGCDDFDTHAVPQFVNAAGGDFHLQSYSPLIDVGNPADPGPGAVDFYGSPRAVQGLACSTVRRDIGAAEYQPPSTPVCGDTYADADTGNDGNDCASPATACLTIGAALSKSGPGDTTFIAGDFEEHVTLGDGKSLMPSAGSPIIAGVFVGGGPGIALTVDPTGAGTVSGLGIRGDATGAVVNGAVTFEGDNFVGGSDATPESAIDVQTNDSVTVADSDIFTRAAATATSGITVDSSAASVVISHNTIGQIDPGNGVLAAGVNVVNGGAELRRNEIFGTDAAVQVTDSSLPVTLSNDLIHDNTVGLQATDTSGDTPPSTQGDVSATNETIVGSSDTDVRLDHTTLTMDSSIVGTPIDLVGANGACDISYSDGPTGTSSNGCGNFDTGADPQFVDPTNGDYHLQSSSPLIDVGNPADPGPGVLDFYGSPRAVQGLACSTVRRDIGAAEFQPLSPPQCAEDTYANVGTGDNNNDCITPSTACLTITAALAKMTAGHTTLIADGTYNETLTLDQGKSLVSLDSTNPKPLIDGGGGTAITVDAGGAGSISGLHLLSTPAVGTAPDLIDVHGAVEVSDNLFDEDTMQAFSAHVVIQPGATGVGVHDNVFDDPDASGFQAGVGTEAGAPSAAIISDNTFTGLAAGVVVINGEPQVSGNQFSGAHPAAPVGVGSGVLVVGGVPTITANTFGPPLGGPSAGVSVIGGFGGAPGATLSRNEISAQDVGVQVVDSTSPVTLSNDLIHGNTTGIESTDTRADSPPSTQGDVSATNETIFDNAVDASVSYTTLTLDSSILGTPIDVVGNNGACSITYSRGSSAASGNGCGNFSTNADPQFVNAASNNYQLQSTSPLIDIGNPADPGPGALDFYGGPRELQGKQCSTVRRDIGAAEYDPGTSPGCPPPPSPPPPTPTPTSEPPAAPKINKQPDKRSDDTTPTFKFSSNVSGSTFRCKLDRAPYKACSSPKTYHGLDVGKHIFRVYAIDPSGKKGKPRVIRFTVTK